MCGRFVSTSSPDRIASYFGAEVAAHSLGENFNVAPTQDIYGVVQGADGIVRVETLHWGLIPSWAKDRKIGNRMINARSETLAEKPAFRGLFKKKRCIIPMDGFYEWKPGREDGPLNTKGKPLKQPLYIKRLDGEPLAVAGLWTAWKDPSDPESRFLHSATVVTTAANKFMEPVHNRMPVFVPESAWATWLDPKNDDVASFSELFAPHDDGALTMYEVSTDVNNVRNRRPDLIDPLQRSGDVGGAG
ncbi:MAG: SOS response-associated peptidase [Actinobacteria bacterium]|nr:MAG: SOS response-associated peptidase [Actinomycetota bacterium]